jgi:hypothetical protein
MTNQKEPLEKETPEEVPDDGRAMGQRVSASQNLAKNKSPDFMKTPVKKVEAFTAPTSFECNGFNGKTYSAFGCCADGSSMADASGSNCAGVAGCSYGKCPGTGTCRTSLSDPCSSTKKFNCKGKNGDVVSAFGCCSDGTAMMDASGSNCGGMAGCRYGKCPGGNTCKTSANDPCTAPTPTNTSITCVGACGTTTSIFGCCSNGTPMNDAAGSNCAGFAVCTYGVCPGTTTCKTSLTDTCSAPAPTSITCVGASGTTTSIYGCCSNGTPMNDAAGSNCAGFAVCNYGVCPGTSTCKTSLTDTCAASSSSCSSTLTPSDPNNMYAGVMPQNTNTVFIPPPTGMLSSQPASVNQDASGNTQDASGNMTQTSSQPSSQTSSQTTSQTSNTPVQPPLTDPPVPAVCPAPRPCPPCGRCPEPAFDCKKVPNYERTDNERLVPQAVLSDFSSFGM